MQPSNKSNHPIHPKKSYRCNQRIFGLIEVVDGFPRFELITPSMFLVHDPGNSNNKNLQDVIDQLGEFEHYNYYTK